MKSAHFTSYLTKASIFMYCFLQNGFFNHVFCLGYAELGRKEEAYASTKELLKAQPAFSLKHWQKNVPYKIASDRDRWINTARNA